MAKPTSESSRLGGKESIMPHQAWDSVFRGLISGQGIFQTMQIRFEKLTVNVDTATTPFWVIDKCLIDCVCALVGVRYKDRLEQDFVRDTGSIFQACGKLLGM